MMKSVCVWSLVAVCVLCVCVAYKPVIIVHGLFDSSADFINLHRFINLSHPGSNVTVLDLFDRSASLQPLWKQVQGFAEAIYPIMQNAADGVHLICYSQGGLVCRGILSTLPDHNVHSFISLSSPQAGQYGDTDYLKYLFPQFVKSNLYHVCYTAVGQKISICNYWNGLDILQTKTKNELMLRHFEQNQAKTKFVLFFLEVQNGLPKQTFRNSSLELQNIFVLPLVSDDNVIGGVRRGSAFNHVERVSDSFCVFEFVEVRSPLVET
ncbi:lysosomal thioesterase PPT2 isoform X2 [Chanodichthys erythropterus]|uniref:lysosomal thioesterase PPT2 isoform X2 n=1 Tax=Chanodichthys erythropterus TaxID=933992 RepID=UPI00351F5FA4